VINKHLHFLSILALFKFVACGEIVDPNILFYFALNLMAIRKVQDELYYYFLLWLNSPTRAQAAPFFGFWIAYNYTQTGVRSLWTSDQPIEEVATTHNKHKRRTPIPLVRFEPLITAF